MKTKICTKCNKNKKLFEFSKDKYQKSGYKSHCKDCRKNYDKSRYNKNRIVIIEKIKKYYKDNKSYILKRIKQYSLKNKDKKKKYNRQYYNDNNETLKRSARKRNTKNYKKYRLRIIKKIVEYHRKLREINPTYRLIESLRCRTRSALKGKNKSLSTMMLIGCEIDYLIFHIQQQFTDGMNWDNYGLDGWEIDHIRPCSSFDLSKKSEQLKCFNYINLQPLWQIKNRQKSNRRI